MIHEVNSKSTSVFKEYSKTNLGAVIDITDHFVMLELEGKNIYELFGAITSQFVIVIFRKMCQKKKKIKVQLQPLASH